MKSDEPPPRMVQLDAPRPLASHERELLDFILSSPLARDELRTQANSVNAVSECDCGCHSIGLEPDASTPSASYTAEDSIYGRTDYLGIRAEGKSARGIYVELILHLHFGRMVELEIWDGALTDGKSQGELPELASLKHRGQI
jgi:hypothetical protein